MKTNLSRMALAAVAATLVLSQFLWAAPQVATTITLDLHCAGCAKKVETQLATVPGVATISSDVKAKTVTVTGKPEAAVSPRALWEAVEKAGKTPTKLRGPSGTFTAKPQS